MKFRGILIVISFIFALLLPMSTAQADAGPDSPLSGLNGCINGRRIQSISYAANTASVSNVRTTWPGALWCFYPDGQVAIQRHNTVLMWGRYTTTKTQIRVNVRYRYYTGAGGTWSNINATFTQPQGSRRLRANITWAAGSMSAACVNNICYSGSKYRSAIFRQGF